MKTRNIKYVGLLVLSLSFLSGCASQEPGTNTVRQNQVEDQLPPVKLTGENKIEVGGQTILNLQVNNIANGEVVWQSENPTIATVDNGVVSGISVGKTKIVVTSKENLNVTTSFEIEVVDDLDNKFDVRFIDYDGSILYQTSVERGQAAEFKGSTPVRLNSYDKKYEFLKWDKPFDNVTSNLDVHAVYAESDFNDYFFEQIGSFYKFVGYSGTDETLVIPTSFNGKSVVEIGAKVLEGNTTVKNLIIPEGIGAIAQKAFSDLTTLETVKLPASLYSIGEQAFYNCSSLTKVEFSEGCTQIGDGMFQKCQALSTIEFPSSLTTIGKNAFFQAGLVSIEIPESITKLGEMSFSSCSNLETAIFNGTMELVPNSTFSSNPKLKSVEITNPAIKTLGMACFMSCKELESVKLVDTIETFGDRCFNDTTKLTRLELSANLLNIGKDCFAKSGIIAEGSEGLVIKETDKKHVIKNGMLLGNSGSSVLMISNTTDVPKNLNFKELGIDSIGNYAFDGVKEIETINIEGLTSVGEYAFNKCTAFTGELTLPTSLTHIGNYGFAETSITKLNLTTVFDDGIMNEGIFSRSTSLVETAIPSGFTEIGARVFGWCNKNFKAIRIPKTVTKIGQYAFQTNANLIITYEGTKEDWSKVFLDGTYAVPSANLNSMIFEGEQNAN